MLINKALHTYIYIHLHNVESDDGPYEGFSDDDDTPTNLATPRECYLWGLLKGKNYSRRNVTFRMVQGRLCESVIQARAICM